MAAGTVCRCRHAADAAEDCGLRVERVGEATPFSILIESFHQPVACTQLASCSTVDDDLVFCCCDQNGGTFLQSTLSTTSSSARPRATMPGGRRQLACWALVVLAVRTCGFAGEYRDHNDNPTDASMATLVAECDKAIAELLARSEAGKPPFEAIADTVGSAPTSKDERGLSIAYLVMVGRSYAQYTVTRLLRATYSPHNLYLLHADAKLEEATYEALRKMLAKHANIHFLSRRHAVGWGAFSMVAVLLDALVTAVSSGGCYDFFINLSDSDLPLRTHGEISAFLAPFRGTSFVAVKDSVTDAMRYRSHAHMRRLAFVECGGRGFAVLNATVDALFGREGRRCCLARSGPILYTSSARLQPPRMPEGVEVFHGSQWVILGRPFVEHLALAAAGVRPPACAAHAAHAAQPTTPLATSPAGQPASSPSVLSSVPSSAESASSASALAAPTGQLSESASAPLQQHQDELWSPEDQAAPQQAAAAAALLNRTRALIGAFRFTYMADEAFVQTALLSSPFRARAVSHNLRYIDWPAGDVSAAYWREMGSAYASGPRVLRLAELGALRTSEAIFARKIDPLVDSQLISAWDQLMERKLRGEQPADQPRIGASLLARDPSLSATLRPPPTRAEREAGAVAWEPHPVHYGREDIIAELYTQPANAAVAGGAGDRIRRRGDGTLPRLEFVTFTDGSVCHCEGRCTRDGGVCCAERIYGCTVGTEQSQTGS